MLGVEAGRAGRAEPGACAGVVLRGCVHWIALDGVPHAGCSGACACQGWLQGCRGSQAPGGGAPHVLCWARDGDGVRTAVCACMDAGGAALAKKLRMKLNLGTPGTFSSSSSSSSSSSLLVPGMVTPFAPSGMLCGAQAMLGTLCGMEPAGAYAACSETRGTRPTPEAVDNLTFNFVEFGPARRIAGWFSSSSSSRPSSHSSSTAMYVNSHAQKLTKHTHCQSTPHLSEHSLQD